MINSKKINNANCKPYDFRNHRNNSIGVFAALKKHLPFRFCTFSKKRAEIKVKCIVKAEKCN